MNLSQLQSLIALVETGSFTEAAEVVHLTQSAVSHSLSALERDLGVSLLERSRKGGVSLTPAGQKIMPHVRSLLAQAEAIEQEAKAAQGTTAGKVRVASMHSFVPAHMLAGLLARFQRQYPEIAVVLFEGALHEVGEWIEQSAVDVGFVILPAPGATTTLLTTDELLVLVPPRHQLSTREAVAPGELRDEPFVMEKTHCALQVMSRAGFAFTAAEPSIRYQASDSATIFAMVREGLGVTLVPRHMVPHKLDGVVALRLDPPQSLPIGLAIKSAETASRAAMLFVETATVWAHEQRQQVT